MINPEKQLNENNLIYLAEKIARHRMEEELNGGRKCPDPIVIEYLRRGGITGERKAAIDSAQAEMLTKKAENLHNAAQDDGAEAALEAYMRYSGKQ